MSFKNPNKTELEKMNQLAKDLGLEKPGLEELLDTVFESLDDSTIEDTEKRDYFIHLDNPKMIEKKNAIIDLVGSPKLTRIELIDMACQIAKKDKIDFIHEAIEAYAISLITASVASGRGVLGGADKKMNDAHEKITKELELGIYKPRSDAKGDIPVSKLMLEARTSKATVISWVKRNGLEKTYGLA